MGRLSTSLRTTARRTSASDSRRNPRALTTGSVAGSIQISGTDEIAHIPFFVAATDYTLIGEELYAASAYLGREPLLLGSLKAQDWGKALIMISLILGGLAASFYLDFFVNLFAVKL